MQPEFETREQYQRYKAARLHRDMMRAIEPFIKAKCEAVALMIPKIVVYCDTGKVEVTYSEADLATMQQFDNAIKSMVDYFERQAIGQTIT